MRNVGTGEVMATQVRIVLNKAGGAELLKGPEITALIEAKCAAIAAAAGEGMKSGVYQGRDRIRGNVWTSTPEAKKAEATDRVLTKAVDAGR